MHDLSKLMFTCPTCEKDTPVTPDNTMIWQYEKQPIYNIVEFHCECGEMFRFFGMQDIVLHSDLSDFTIITALYADDETIKAFAKIYFSQLTKDQEKIVKEFCDELDHLNQTDCDWGDI